MAKYLRFIGLILFIVVLIWAIEGAEVNITNIVTGVPNIIDYLGSMFPPDASILSRIGGPIAETFQIAIMAIIFSTLIALPVSFLAARNIMPNRVIYQITRTTLGALRGIPPLLYALLFVAMVGLGPFAGVLALTCHCIGGLGRFFSEAIENINPEVINIAKAAGASKLQIIVYAVIPELAALLVGYILYYFESNFRHSTVLGLVGAGGIGLPLMTSVHLFRYGEVATIILIIVALITIMDRMSIAIRTRIIKGSAAI